MRSKPYPPIKLIVVLLLLVLSPRLLRSQAGSVLQFDGVDDYISFGTTALKPTAGLTAEAWINPASWSSTCTILGNTQASGYAIWMSGGTLYGYVYRNGSYGIVSTDVSAYAAAWYHVALTYDGRYTRLYVDAVLMSTDDAGGTYPIFYTANTTYFGAESFTVGALAPQPGFYYQGQLDEVRIWNYARSQCQIYTTRGCEIATSAPGLLGNYHFNQGTAGGNNTLIIILTDASGNLNHGSLFNMALNLSSSNFQTPGPFSNGFTTTAPTPTVTTGQEYTVTIGLPNGQTNVSDWSPYVTTFTNPLPAGAVVTGMNLSLDGVDQGWGGTGCTASFYAGGEYIAGFVFSHGLQGFSGSVTKAFPYYNYGGINTFSLYFCGWPGWQAFIYNVSLSIRYTLLNTAPIAVCQNSTVILQGYGASTYTWSGGVINGSPTPVNTSQTYTVTGLVYGCASSNTVQVNAIPAPTIHAVLGNTFVCLGSSLTLSLNTSGAISSYSWTTGASTSSIMVSPLSSTAYTATATNTSGCSHTGTTFVTVGSLPTISVNSGSICSGQSFTLNASGASTFTYSGGSSVVSPTVNNSYSVTGTDGLGCVSAGPAISNVTVYTTPTVAVNSGSVCSGQSFTITPSGALNYTFLSGSSVVTPFTSSSYSVIGASLEGCVSSNTAISSVVVFTLPVVSISTPTAATCAGGSITLSGQGADTYTWTGGITNGMAFVPAASATYSVSGTNTLTGCNSALSASINVTVQALPVITVPNYTLCSGSSVSLIPTGANTYTFSGGSALVSPTVSSNYSVTGSSTAGCISALPAVSTVTVYTTPTVALSSGSICAGQSIALIPSGAGGYTISGGTFTVSPLVNTSYSLSGTSLDGCPSANTAVSTVTVFARPVVAISTSSNALCSGASVTLSASNASSYTWNPGGLVGATVAVSPTTSTTYSLVGTSTAGCSSTNAPVQVITVHNRPLLSTTTASLVICAGNNTVFTVSGANTYTWNPGNLSGASITVTPLANTSYTVSGSSVFGCLSQNTLVSSVTVNPLPVLGLTSNTASICFGQQAILTASGANTYSLNPGALNGNSFTLSPVSTTIYSLSGTNTLSGCSSLNGATLTLTVNPLPVVSISSNSLVLCFGQSAVLSASNAASYTWQPGNGSGSSFTVTPAATTTYTLNGTSAAGCTNTNNAVLSISVNPLPVVTASVSPAVICAGASLSLIGGGANTYTWSGGAPNAQPFAPAASSGYTVNGTNTLTGCTSTNSAFVNTTVNPLPIVGVNSSTSAVCMGGSLSLSGTGASTYTWTGGIQNAVPFSPTISSQYTVSGTSSLACINTAVQSVTVYPLPVVSASASSTVICAGQTVSLNGSGADTYTWSPSAPNGSAFSPTGSATYSLVGSFTLSGCSSTNNALQVVQVNLLPVVTATASNPEICFGFSTSLIGGGANTYVWSGGQSNAVAFNPTTSASYTVIGTDLNSCTNTAVASVSVNPLPQLTVSSSQVPSCEAETFTLIASGASTYTWNTNANTAQIIDTLLVTTIYTVQGTDSKGCQNSTVFTQSVTVCNANFIVSVDTVNVVTCRGRNDGYITLAQNIGYSDYKTEYFWSSPNATLSCPANDCQKLDKLTAGDYSVKVKLTYTLNNFYVKHDSLFINSIQVTEDGRDCMLEIYNGLTLNNDGNNDTWIIKNIDLYPKNKVKVFDRWGKELCSIDGYHNTNNFWPNTDQIKDLQSTTYYYTLDLGDGSALKKGWLEVIKN